MLTARNTLPQAEGRLDTTTIKSRKIPGRDARIGEAMTENRRLASLLLDGEIPEWLEEDQGIVRRVGQRLKLCNGEQFVGITKDKRVIVQDTYHCMNRWCKICGGNRSRAWQRKIAGWLDPETGAVWMDGNGKLAGDRGQEEIMSDLSAKLSHIAVMHGGVPGKPASVETAQTLQDKLDEIEQRAVGEMHKHRETLYWHLVTFTIPNIPHVWAYRLDEEGKRIGYSPLDAALLHPFRKMLLAAKKTRRKKAGKPSNRGRKPVVGLRMIGKWRGYIAVLEITYNRRAQTFHPHLHVLVLTTSRWLPKSLLLAAWRHYAGPEVTQVDARRADPRTVGRELIKYMTKTKTIQNRKPAKEIARALYRRRAIWTGGAAYGVKYSAWARIANQEDRLQRPASDSGWHVKRQWNTERQQWEYQIVGRATSDSPIRTQEDRLVGRKPGWDGELLPDALLQHAVDRRYTRSRSTFRPSDDPMRLERWDRKAQSERHRMMYSLYRKNDRTFVIYEWILLLVQTKFAELLPVVGGQPWKPDESGNGWIEVDYGYRQPDRPGSRQNIWGERLLREDVIA